MDTNVVIFVRARNDNKRKSLQWQKFDTRLNTKSALRIVKGKWTRNAVSIIKSE